MADEHGTESRPGTTLDDERAAEREVELLRAVEQALAHGGERASDTDTDTDALLVYADWLQSRGDPHGELIAVQCVRADAPDDGAAREREVALLGEHMARFFGPPQPLSDVTAPRWEELSSWRRRKSWPTHAWAYGWSHTQWEHGFIRNVLFDTGYYSDDEVHEGARAAAILAGLLDAPTARFVREIAIGEIWMDSYEGPDTTHAIRAIAQAPCARHLRVLDVLGGDHDLSGVTLDASALYPACPALETVVLYAGQLTVGDIDLPCARVFAARTGGLDSSDARAIARARWPMLEELEIWFGDSGYGATSSVDDIGPILDGAGLGALRRLKLRNMEFGDELCEALATAPVVAQLHELDLTMGVITDDGARHLLAQASRFSHLSRLAIAGYFSPEIVGQLDDLCGQVEVERRGGPDERYRYVEVGE